MQNRNIIVLNGGFMQSFKVASALTASAVSAAFNGAVSVNKAIIQRQAFIRCVRKKLKTTCYKESFFFFFYAVSHLVWQNIRELGFLAFQSLRACLCLWLGFMRNRSITYTQWNMISAAPLRGSISGGPCNGAG